MNRVPRVVWSTASGLLLMFCSACLAWAAEASGAAVVGSERLALVTFVDRSLKRAPSAAPGDAYALTSAYQSTPWGRRIATELGQRHNLQMVNQWPVLTLGVHCVVYKISDERSLSAVITELRAEKIVSGVYPMNDFHTLAADPYAPLQSAVTDMQLAQAHRFSTGRYVTIAVVDTAIDIEHPDLRGQISTYRDLVNDSDEAILNEAHGTAVGGVIAARTGNAAGIIGVAPAARLAALRACWPRAPDALDATCNTLTLAKAIDTAIRLKVQVINLSLSGPRDALLEALLETALAQGVKVVGAMPAIGRAADAFPTAVAGVVRVGVVGQADAHATVIAPGTEVFTTMPTRRYGYISGSSIAAAHVSGVIALLLEIAPSLSSTQVVAYLSQDNPHTEPLARTVNACLVLARAKRGVKCVSPTATLGTEARRGPVNIEPTPS